MKSPADIDHFSNKSGPSTRYAWFVVGMLWCISFFNYADRQAIFSVFPLLGEEMHLTNTDKGLLGSSFAIVYGLASPLAGGLVDRMRRKTAILGGLQAWSIICVATALSRRYWHLIIFRAAEGLGETFYYPASVSLISDYHGRATRSRALGFHQTSVYVGTVAGGFFAALVGQYYGWRASFIVFGALGMFLGLVLQRFLHEPLRGAADLSPVEAAHTAVRTLTVAETIEIIAATPTALILMLAFFSANFVAMVLLAWMPTLLTEQFGLSLSQAGLVGTIFPQGASMLGAALGGWSADAWRRRTGGGRILVQALAVVAACPFVFAVGQAATVYMLAAFLTCWGLFKGFYDANIFAAAFDVIPPAARGSVAGLMNLVGWTGAFVSGLVIGPLADSYGLPWAVSAACIAYLVAGGLLLLAAFRFVNDDERRAFEFGVKEVTET